MDTMFGTQVFWTTVIAVPLLLSCMTLLGRLLSAAFPVEVRAAARFYLSPVLGLAGFVIIASVVGQRLPLGDTVLVPLSLLAVIAIALTRDPAPSELKRYLPIVGGFGLVCGTSILVPLYVSGAINAHNDTFTYLAHGNWLQHHAFADQIPADQVTPAGTQVRLYQLYGFRMGASFVLGFFQAAMHIRWSYDIYPAMMISAVAACCLAIGFPVATLLGSLRTDLRLALLALPGFSIGGLVFGANYGFLPQTVGLALAAGAIFATGSALHWLRSEQRSIGSILKTAAPVALLLAAQIYAYSELAPFLAIAIGASGLLIAARFRAWRNVIIFGVALALMMIVLGNFELLRAYQSLRSQAGAVVGSPVEWSILGFIGHAIGLQAGAWDSQAFNIFAVGWGLLLVLVLLVGFRFIRWTSLRPIISSLVPVLALLAVLFCGLVYFRYIVASPFPVGTGQSWSQFKLTEWAHPFASVLVVAVVAAFLAGSNRRYRHAVFVLVVLAAFGSGLSGVLRMRDIVAYYGDTDDLGAFYLKFRQTVFTACPTESPVYLALGGSDYKFRQIASLYLDDRNVRSDWGDDPSIYPWISPDRVRLSPKKGNCLVEGRQKAASTATDATSRPLFRIEPFDGIRSLKIASVTGAYGYEGDTLDWWRWVEQSATFNFTSVGESEKSKLALHFEYLTRADEPLVVEISDGASESIHLDVAASPVRGTFTQNVQVIPSDKLKVTVSSKSKPQAMGDKDPRLITFQIRNLSVDTIP